MFFSDRFLKVSLLEKTIQNNLKASNTIQNNEILNKHITNNKHQTKKQYKPSGKP